MTGAANDAWGGATLTVTVGGVDVSCDVLEVTVDRSKNRVWDPADAGLCTVTLDISPSGQPTARGPVGSIVTVHVAYGTAGRTLFTGRVQKRGPKVLPTVGDQLALWCVDEFEQLARVNRRAGVGALPVGAGETVTARLNRWLDEAGSTSARAIGTSTYTCPEVLVDGNILRQLQATAQADGGDLFIAGDGTVTFLPWAWQVTADSAAALLSDQRRSDVVVYSNATLAVDLDEVQNKVTGTRRKINELDNPEPQTVANTSSVTTYGERGDAVDELELDSDTQVVTRVAGLVTVAAQPNARFDQIVVQPGFDPPRGWPRLLPVTFGSLIAGNRTWADASTTALYGHVIGEVWTITPTDATVELRCSGTGTWDALRPPRLPIALEVCPDGSLHVPDGYPCDLTSEVVIKDAAGTVLVTYPPGSLCHCGVVFVPDGGVTICYDDGTTQVCTPIVDPRATAILWFDADDTVLNGLVERIDRDIVTPGAGFNGTRLDVIPGLYDAVDANSGAGGLIGGSHSSHLAAATLSGAWTIDFHLYLGVGMANDIDIPIIDLAVVQVHLTTLYNPDRFIAQLEVAVVTADLVTHLSGPLCDVPAFGWHHWRLEWNTDNVGLELSVLMDGSDPP